MATDPTPPPNTQPPGQPGRRGTTTPGPKGADGSKTPEYREYRGLQRKLKTKDLTPAEYDRLVELYKLLAAQQDATTVQPDPTPSGQPADPLAAAAKQPTGTYRLADDNNVPPPGPGPTAPTGSQPPVQPGYDPNNPDEISPPPDPPETYKVSPPEDVPPRDPLRDFGGPNDPAAEQRGGNGKPVDVNIVGSIPLPVFMTRGGQPGVPGDQQPGSPADQPPEHDAYGNPIDAEHKALSGQTVQEAFNKFAGGYAAGYPIHNLKQLGKNLFGIGKSAVRGIAGKFGRKKRKKDEDDTQRVGGFSSKKSGKPAQSTAVPNTSGRKPIKPSGPAKVTGGGGKVPTTAASGLMGEAASVGRLAAIGGAAGTAVAGIGIFVAAIVKASQEVYSFARAQEEEVRRLADLNASLAVATATLDMGRLERDIEMGRATEESGATLTDSIDRFERAIAPIQEVATNIANTVGGALLDTITSLATVVSDAIHWWRGTTATPTPDRRDEAWDVFARMAREAGRTGRRDWPGAG